MSEAEGLPEQQLSRDRLLRLAAGAGGAVLLARRGRRGGHALTAESGRLQVLDWVGYGNDGGQSMFARYVKTHPKNKPQFTVMTNESRWRAPRGAEARPLPPLRRLGQVLRDEWARPAVEPEAPQELQEPEPVHGQGRASTTAGSTASPTTGASTPSCTAPTRSGPRHAPGACSSTTATRGKSPGTTT